MIEAHNEQPLPLRRKRQYFLAFIIGTAIFTFGMVAGGSLLILLFKDRLRPPPMQMERLGQSLAEDMGREFSLSPEQVSQLSVIFEQHVADLKVSREQAIEEMQTNFSRLDAEVTNIIGKENAEAWNEKACRVYRYWPNRDGKPRRGHHMMNQPQRGMGGRRRGNSGQETGGGCRE